MVGEGVGVGSLAVKLLARHGEDIVLLHGGAIVLALLLLVLFGGHFD